ncbi:MAG: signal peptidase I [Cyanobacteria bacterium]|nr:signal peptidase I [Cyanobacteriota bacterium]
MASSPDPAPASPPSADSSNSAGSPPGSPSSTPGPANRGEDPSLPWWRQLWRGQRENIRVLAIALGIALVLRLWVAEPRFIPSNSMEPTLHIGDRLIVEKVSYHLQPPQPGDIIVFQPPEQLYPYGYSAQQAFIKRVVAVPGQTVTITGQQVYVDGVPQTEPYIQAPPAYEMVPVRVPPGGVFVLGDNRNDSNDSHVWGILPQANIIGRALLRFWPLDHWQWQWRGIDDR